MEDRDSDKKSGADPDFARAGGKMLIINCQSKKISQGREGIPLGTDDYIFCIICNNVIELVTRKGMLKGLEN